MANILIAEDEEGLRLLLRRQLVRAGHTVVECIDGADALKTLEEQAFDLVLSDMKMPRLDGMGLICAARDRNLDVDFIVLTGHGSLEGAVEAFQTGIVRDYLLKPLDDIRTLNIVVDRALERRQLQKDNARLVKELQSRINVLEATKRKLVRMTEEDALTGLLNYRGIHERLERLFEEGNPSSVAVVLLDADHFKYLNDLYGHPFGDQVLCMIAETLSNFFGSDVSIGRCGGDEFMAVCPGATAAVATEYARRVQEHMNRTPITTPTGDKIPISLSFGIADLQSVDGNSGRLVAAADVALYQGKEQGRGRITMHGDAPTEEKEIVHPIAEIFAHLDRNSKDHSEQMAQYAHRLAQYLGLSEDACNAVLVAGILHDIGKIGVPESVLLKPGSLTSAEYEQVKEHVTYSIQIIQSLPLLEQILTGVAHHHERWDGKGYPNGLRETEIPLIGRILAIADAFSAMVLNRPYRSSLTIEQALQEIEQNSGVQFDPELASLFVGMVLKENHKADKPRLVA